MFFLGLIIQINPCLICYRIWIDVTAAAQRILTDACRNHADKGVEGRVRDYSGIHIENDMGRIVYHRSLGKSSIVSYLINYVTMTARFINDAVRQQDIWKSKLQRSGSGHLQRHRMTACQNLKRCEIKICIQRIQDSD